MSFKDKNPALLLIDIQQGFDDEAYWGGNRNNLDAEAIAGQLLKTLAGSKPTYFSHKA